MCKQFSVFLRKNAQTMNTTSLKLSQLKTNKANPRTISKDKFQKLVNSLLVFPEMLAIRPVVVDGQLAALGGNMWLNALQAIAKMSPDEVAQRLASTPEYAASAPDMKLFDASESENPETE